MEKMRKPLISGLLRLCIGFVFPILLLTACFSDQPDESSGGDPFYTDTRREDLDRLPLVKPLELYSADGGSTWFFDLPFGEVEMQDQVTCVMVGMKDSILVVYTDLVSLPGETTDAWFCCDLDQRSTTVFRSSEAFRNTAFNASIEMHSVRKAFAQFRQTGELPWQAWIEEREAKRQK